MGRIEARTNLFLNDNRQLALSGIGVGAPNGNHFTGMIQDPPNLSWGNVNIVELFKERFDCKASLTNDANAAALGEKHYGVAKDMNEETVFLYEMEFDTTYINADEIQIDTKVSAIIFITPVIRFEIDTKDEICHL